MAHVLNMKRAIPGGEADGVVMGFVAYDGIETVDCGEAFLDHRFDIALGGVTEFSAAGALIEGLLEIPPARPRSRSMSRRRAPLCRTGSQPPTQQETNAGFIDHGLHGRVLLSEGCCERLLGDWLTCKCCFSVAALKGSSGL